MEKHGQQRSQRQNRHAQHGDSIKRRQRDRSMQRFQRGQRKNHEHQRTEQHEGDVALQRAIFQQTGEVTCSEGQSAHHPFEHLQRIDGGQPFVPAERPLAQRVDHYPADQRCKAHG